MLHCAYYHSAQVYDKRKMCSVNHRLSKSLFLANEMFWKQYKTSISLYVSFIADPVGVICFYKQTIEQGQLPERKGQKRLIH